MALALTDYAGKHPELCGRQCVPVSFCGQNGKLSDYVQWIYVPAVKEIAEEGEETKNTALGRLVGRAVRSKCNFDEELNQLKAETLSKYEKILEKNDLALTKLTESLQNRLQDWAHPGAKISMTWLKDNNKAISVLQPNVGIAAGEGSFTGNLARLGHGLQRSYLLALLQELAESEGKGTSTLILGCEEPEIYQHPPQARHLCAILEKLASKGTQVLVTTHSPLFVTGESFQNLRLVSSPLDGSGSRVRSVTHANLCAKIRQARGETVSSKSETGLLAKIHQALQPGIAEMFFCRIPVLVEGLEDVSYITTYLHLLNLWDEFRKLGCHLVAVNGKDKLIQPLAMAKELGMPVYLIFDADDDTVRTDHKIKHEKDNKTLIELLGLTASAFPAADTIEANHCIWKNNLGDAVKADYGAHHPALLDSARQSFSHEGGLEKHDLFIAEWLSDGWDKGHKSAKLDQLCKAILDFARTT